MWDHLGRLRWEYGKSVNEIAKDHKHVCTMSTIYRLTEEWYLLGGVRNPKQMSGGDRRSKMTIEHRNLLFTQCAKTPWWFLDEYEKFFLVNTGVKYSLKCLARVFRKQGYTSKKLERMSTKRSAILRAQYVSSMKGFDPECMTEHLRTLVTTLPPVLQTILCGYSVRSRACNVSLQTLRKS